MQVIEYISIEKLSAHPQNPRKVDAHQMAILCDSIKANPDYFEARPILCNKEYVIFAGNMRFLAAKQIGLKEVPCAVMDITPERQREIMIRDNRQNGEWDFDTLANTFSVDELLSWGFESKELLGTNWSFGISNSNEILDDVAHKKLTEHFIVPPFSILDSRQGYWLKRKQAWRDIMGVISETRTDVLFKSKSGGVVDYYSKKTEVEKLLGRSVTNDEFEREYLTTEMLNDGSSSFDPVLAEIIFTWFSPKRGKILDPFAGEQVKGIVAGELKMPYSGVDLRQEQVDVNNKACAKYPDVKFYAGDSNNIDTVVPDSDYDLIFTSPPYYDLEIYSKADMSALGTYEEFMAQYKNIFTKAVAKLKDNRFVVVKVGEIRAKDTSVYRNFVGDNIMIFKELGLKYWNELILVTMAGTLPIRAPKQFNTSRLIGKSHQNILVFFKGDPDTLKTWGEIVPENIEAIPTAPPSDMVIEVKQPEGDIIDL